MAVTFTSVKTIIENAFASAVSTHWWTPMYISLLTTATMCVAGVAIWHIGSFLDLIDDEEQKKSMKLDKETLLRKGVHDVVTRAELDRMRRRYDEIRGSDRRTLRSEMGSLTRHRGERSDGSWKNRRTEAKSRLEEMLFGRFSFEDENRLKVRVGKDGLMDCTGEIWGQRAATTRGELFRLLSSISRPRRQSQRPLPRSMYPFEL